MTRDFVLVSDDEIRAGQALMIETARNLIEVTCEAHSAAALRVRERLAGRPVVLVLRS